VGALDPRSYTLVLLMPIGVSKQVWGSFSLNYFSNQEIVEFRHHRANENTYWCFKGNIVLYGFTTQK
jgi:hypothetical protein